MKLVVDARSDRVVGCHMLGPDAPEIIQGLAIAVKCGATEAAVRPDRRHSPECRRGVRDDARENVRPPEKLAAE